ncbi:hypothetical protein MHU86_7012 [Fragilaria crotonensis]|nr:hypothetical protein MHU86_7012 [Fragilaria crotonensis]
MESRRLLWSLPLLALLLAILVILLPDEHSFRIRRRLLGTTEETPKALKFNLPGSAAEWCSPPILPPLPYDTCTDKTVINSLPLYGGLTNSLKMLLLGVILSFEENRCFFVDESQSELLKREDPRESLDSLINRYFEPIGLPYNSNVVQTAKQNQKIDIRDWKVVWEMFRNRRMYGQVDNIASLHYPNIEGHLLKRVMMRRMWRPLPRIREETCAGLANHIQGQEFMTFSVRRGDKASQENFSFATMQQYIDTAEQVIPGHFGGKVPIIFVATDDCTAMKEFRDLRPSWRFVSECDREQQAVGHGGFALADMAKWSQKDTDAHYSKFFIELYAMATAKFFIGVWYTNVSW